ncbi:MAG: aminodeoxychorismate synthase component I [Saccharofermentans sp.]|nr:aminodeoxychorismate synthase component I [Saccharofermentans sp.]
MIIKRLSYLDPGQVFDLVSELEEFSILDSSLASEENRYTIIGICPFITLEQIRGITYVDGNCVNEPFEEVLEGYLKKHRGDYGGPLPFNGGFIGYLSYGYCLKFENIQSRHKTNTDMPEAFMCCYEHVLVFDLWAKELYLCSMSGTTYVEELLKAPRAVTSKPYAAGAQISYDFEEEEYKRAVSAVIEHIYEGDVYIANLTQRMIVESKLDPHVLFLKMRETNPSPFGAFIKHKGVSIVSASPERFIRIKDNKISTKPIKGTRPRGKTPEEDARYREELISSQKDKSELLMIVDLERNDLNRICVPGSVTVKELFALETYATVFHLVSTVEGSLKDDAGISSVLRAMLPGGSITGAPKIEAMKVIDKLENSGRDLYTGSIGYLAFNGDADLNIVIRTAVYEDGVYTIGIGGGITCESDPSSEYEETLQKGLAFKRIFEEHS